MNVYIGKADEVKKYNIKQVHDIIRPLVHSFQSEKSLLKRKYGECYNKYILSFNVQMCDFAVLPYSWNYYRGEGKMDEAERFITLCKSADKEVITVNTGDFGVKPGYNDIIIFRQSGYQSKRLRKQFAMPVFIDDPVNVFFNGKVTIREKKESPLVGFCGQGKQPGYKYVLTSMVTSYRNLKYYFRASHNEPQVIYPSTLRRNRVLRNLMNSDKVKTDFIIREKYRGGVKNEEEMFRTTMEFYNNIRGTDYTVCIRGGGNFSVRIYETLANGRIPLFINTDSILPLDNIINWKDHVVWVEESEIKYIDEKLSDFHNEIHPDDFKQLQINNRNLWKEFLSSGGFYCHLYDFVKKIKETK
jgi:hypothetical protein